MSMRYVVLANHHGAFITADSVKSIYSPRAGDKLMILVSLLKSEKYRNERLTSIDADFVGAFAARYPEAEVIAVPSLDFSNPIVELAEYADGPTFFLSAGTILQKRIDEKEFEGVGYATASPFVYLKNKRLSMYHMIKIPTHSKGDYGAFFINNRNQSYRELPRRYNNKSDPLIGLAISARETVLHGASALNAHVISYWGDAIRSYDRQEPEQIFAYPYEIYAEYAKNLVGFLPQVTIDRIVENGAAANRWKAFRGWMAKYIKATNRPQVQS